METDRIRARGITLWEVLCVIAIIAFLCSLLMPSLSRVKCSATRIVCGTNLKGLGTAIIVYANDYQDRYPQLPGDGPWAKELGFAYDMDKPDFAPGSEQSNVGRTISASWYLLVREADVSPKSFVCSEARQSAFGGRYSSVGGSKDITEMWDFGDDPYEHVSYSMHNPYGEFPADGTRTASFAVAADMSPWFENGDIVPPGADGKAPQLLSEQPRSSSLCEGPGPKIANSPCHGGYKGWGGVGQNVLFADGHNSFGKRSDVGVERDGIYTFWPDAAASDEQKTVGVNPTGRSTDNDAKDVTDSFLAI